MLEDEKIYGLIAQAEDIQRHAQALQHSAEDAVRRLPEATRGAIRGAADEILAESTKKATESLIRASEGASMAGAILRRTAVLQGVFLLAVALVVAGAGYFALGYVYRERLADLAEVKAQVNAERATFAELQRKTWRLELVKYDDGTRGIILPKGTKIDRTGTVPDGRSAIVIRP